MVIPKCDPCYISCIAVDVPALTASHEACEWRISEP